MTEPLLRAALWTLVALNAAAVLALLGHGLWLSAARRRAERWRARGRPALNAALTAERLEEAELEVLRSVPLAHRTRLVQELAPSLSGSARARLAEVAREIGVWRHARRRLRSRAWPARLAAARTLMTLEQSEEVFLPLLGDPHPAVRAQAAEWAGEHPTPAAAAALLRILPGAAPLVRFAVQDALLRLRGVATAPLADFLARHDGPAVLPALLAARGLARPDFAAPAARLCHDPDPAVRAAAADLLGAVGSELAVAEMVRLLGDPDARVRAAAVHAIGRLGHWPAAAAVAERLRDPSWDVRLAAGTTLRGLGSPGELMLRRYTADADRFAADMARRVLEIPGRAVEAGRA